MLVAAPGHGRPAVGGPATVCMLPPAGGPHLLRHVHRLQVVNVLVSLVHNLSLGGSGRAGQTGARVCAQQKAHGPSRTRGQQGEVPQTIAVVHVDAQLPGPRAGSAVGRTQGKQGGRPSALPRPAVTKASKGRGGEGPAHGTAHLQQLLKHVLNCDDAHHLLQRAAAWQQAGYGALLTRQEAGGSRGCCRGGAGAPRLCVIQSACPAGPPSPAGPSPPAARTSTCLSAKAPKAGEGRRNRLLSRSPEPLVEGSVVTCWGKAGVGRARGTLKRRLGTCDIPGCESGRCLLGDGG